MNERRLQPAAPALTAALLLLAAPVSADEPTSQPTSQPTESRADEGSAAVRDGTPRVRATLVADRASAGPGETFRAGVLLEMAEGWHVYWLNPGQTGLATEVGVSSPHATSGDIIWPAPHVFQDGGGFITSFGYDDRVLLGGPLTVADDHSGPVQVAAFADFLACDEVCIPGRIELETTLGGPDSPGDVQVNAAAFDAAASRTPTSPRAVGVAVEARLSQPVIAPGNTAILTLTARPDGAQEVLPADGDATLALAYRRATQLDVEPIGVGPAEGGGFTMTVSLTAGPDAVEDHTLTLHPLLIVDGQRVALEVAMPIDRTP